jgi:endonuclease/exonuclease/phosphatase family metal-dependent hydrolase
MDTLNEYPSLSTSTGQPSTQTAVNDDVSPITMHASTAESMDDIVFAQNVEFSGSQMADAPNTETPQVTNTSETVAKCEFVIYAMNVHGLTNDDRLEELERELKLVKEWDVMVLTETWRKPKNEYFETIDGNIFMNCGCDAARRGVGFLVHRKWSSFIQEFVPLNERVSYLRLKVGRKTFVVIGAYFPHTGYPDHDVEEMYATISSILEQCKQKKELVLIGGDFNAEIGERNEFDDPLFIGKHTIGTTNPRGAWLKRFCSFNGLAISNTLYPKRKENITTYVGPNLRPRQIDYILVDRKTKRLLQDATSAQEPNIGSDHKAVRIRLRLDVKFKARKTKRRVDWHHICPELFHENLERMISQQEISSNSNQTCHALEQTMLRAATESENSRSAREETHQHSNQADEQVRALIKRRWTVRHGTAERTEISKRIQKGIRKLKREKRRRQIKARLDEFKNIKHIPRFKTREKSRYITQMVDEHGKIQTSRMSIANIFASFYEELYSKKGPGVTNGSTENVNGGEVPVFTENELMKALKTLKSGKCKDTAGIKAEMLKNIGYKTRKVLLDLFNSILQGTSETPKSWRKSVITVLYKSGDSAEAKNYRPICIIPVLYKLFSKLLYSRLYPILDLAQSPDQAGFRHNYSTLDHLFVFKMLQEKSEEFQLNTWAAALDFKKAFDSIDQLFIWEALEDQQVPIGYIRVLKDLYREQHARVKTDRLSRSFQIQRGTKQGDPLSSLLFNAVLEKVMRRAKENFEAKKYGIQLGTTDSSRLTNLRFADDVLITAKSLNQLTEMIKCLKDEALKCGLELHPDKTKIISSTNRNGRPAAKHAKVGDLKIEILQMSASLKYLGCQISFGEMQEMELRQRIRGGWAKFMEHKQELTGKHYSVNSRLKLFNAVVTPAVLYCSECWTTSKHLESILKTTQRKMLRMVLGQGRRRIPARSVEQDSSGEDVQSNASNNANPEEEETLEDPQDELEPFVDWIRRVTHSAEERIKNLNMRSWVEEARFRKWKWARNLYTEKSSEQWSTRALHWNPQVHYDRPKPAARRRPTRPNLRWLDDVLKISHETSGTATVEDLKQEHFWTQYQDLYVNRS